MKKDERKESILIAALQLAADSGGWSTLTRDTVAKAANCSDGLVTHYFGTMQQLRRTVMRAAIKRKNLSIVAQGIIAGDTNARKVCDQLKLEAIDYLKNL